MKKNTAGQIIECGMIEVGYFRVVRAFPKGANWSRVLN